ncbi:ABC transporter substrate-binding protein [Tardisphaera saccharovorans]
MILLLLAVLLPSGSAQASSGITVNVAFTPQESDLGYLVTASIASTGISAIPENLSWTAAYSRVFYQSGLNYSQGGYDAFLLSEVLSPSVNPFNPIYSLVSTYVPSVAGNLSKYEETGFSLYLQAALDTISENSYEIPLFYARPLWALSPQISGFNPTLSAYFPEPWLWSGTQNVTYIEYGPVPSTVLPMFGATGLPAYAVFQPLVIPSSSGYAPCLAVNWTQSNSTTWYVYLRRGVSFQNGQPMTADDVVWSIKAVLDPLTGSTMRQLYGTVLGNAVKLVLSNGTTYYTNGTSYVGQVIAVNDHEVEFVLPKPFALFYPVFLSNVFVYPMNILAKLGDEGLLGSEFSLGSAAVGTGPYEIAGVVQGTYDLKAFSGYWNGTPNIDHIEVVYSERGVQYELKLMNQGGAYVLSYEFWPYQFYRSIPRVHWAIGQPVIYVGLMLNLKSPIWGTGTALPSSKVNPTASATYATEFREALSRAIPTSYLCEAFFRGLAEPASSPLVPEEVSWSGASMPKPATYNATAVHDLMEAVGYNLTVSPIAFSVAPWSLNEGSAIRLYGYVIYNGTPVRAGQITVMAGKPFKVVQKVQSNEYGTFNATMYPPSGNYYIELSYPGNVTSYGVVPPLSSAVQGPIKVVNWWEQNVIYVVVLVLLMVLLIFLVIHVASRHR